MRLKRSFLKRTKNIRARLFDYPLSPLETVENAVIREVPGTAIPPVVYQTWEENLFGKRHLAALQAFRANNPDLCFILMDRKARDDYMAATWGQHPAYRIYKGAQFGPMRADIFRYCLLHDRGGYYFDINKAVTRPIRALHPAHATAMLSHELSECNILPDREILGFFPHPGQNIIQWSFGFAAGHPFLKRTIDCICDYADTYANRVFHNPKSAILQLTGPGVFTKAVRDCLKADPALATSLCIVGENYGGAAETNLPGSEVRYLRQPPYFQSRNQPILILPETGSDSFANSPPPAQLQFA
ncbi:glycosyltransferase family 32 protein [Pannonibacter sp.]|uniref:glycosyltransferase family 32 protein n=1 Tax=Pannonibacter sp. TaxID=1906786 RepID=UPI003F7081A5